MSNLINIIVNLQNFTFSWTTIPTSLNVFFEAIFFSPIPIPAKNSYDRQRKFVKFLQINTISTVLKLNIYIVVIFEIYSRSVSFTEITFTVTIYLE